MPYLSTSEVMFHEEALYQVYVPLPLVIARDDCGCSRVLKSKVPIILNQLLSKINCCIFYVCYSAFRLLNFNKCTVTAKTWPDKDNEKMNKNLS